MEQVWLNPIMMDQEVLSEKRMAELFSGVDRDPSSVSWEYDDDEPTRRSDGIVVREKRQALVFGAIGALAVVKSILALCVSNVYIGPLLVRYQITQK